MWIKENILTKYFEYISVWSQKHRVFIKQVVNHLEARPLWYPFYFAFLAILNAISRNILSEVALLGKYSKSS